jgi:hypothetical protein
VALTSYKDYPIALQINGTPENLQLCLSMAMAQLTSANASAPQLTVMTPSIYGSPGLDTGATFSISSMQCTLTRIAIPSGAYF